MYQVSDYHNVLAAFVEVQEAMEIDPKIGLFVNTRKDYIAVGLFYADWSAELPRVFDPFSKLTSLIAAVVPTTNGTLVKLMNLLEQWAYKEKDLKSVSTHPRHFRYPESRFVRQLTQSAGMPTSP